MRRKITALLVMCGMLLAFTACDKGESSSTKDESSVSETTAATEEVTEEVAEEVTEAVTEELVEPDYPTFEVDENSITFDDGDVYTAHCMNEQNFENGESNCNISVAEYKGQKQLKIEVLDKNDAGNYNIPKIVFDVDELVGSENLSKIKTFSVDITQVAVGEFIGDDGVGMLVPGNLMGSFGSNVGPECADWYEPTGTANNFLASEWNFEWVYHHAEGKWLLKGYVDGTTDSTLVFMRWNIPNQADIYIDNLTFYDEAGNSIPIVYTPGATAEGGAEEGGETAEGETAENSEASAESVAE